eukprot:CAMPEP_0194358266 /NCGR_PEP_ID=MMETSP0174-20130528/5533_1 /TAXON_ID=216777 /ORGANISM="Proboscia alata, Strain PI-D3" /LENGTH=1732 /DNA_ID=CAMNT_0039128529 /DNA_START=27 /DNA_END=5225 /DNA_ORIENTATION=-
MASLKDNTTDINVAVAEGKEQDKRQTKLTGKDAPTITDEKEKQDVEADAVEAVDVSAAVAQQLIHNLVILPPLQKKSLPATGVDEGVIQLPTLQKTEPVSSLRAALGELVSYAHYTNYRFAIVTDDGSNDEKGSKNVIETIDLSEDVAGTVVDATNHHHSNGGKKNGKTKPKGGDEKHQLWSPFTSRNAVVAAPYSLRSLELTAPENSTNGNTAPSTSNKCAPSKEEELVLDDYGDLSNIPTPATDDNTSKIKLRMILERYDDAGLRDHVTRLLNMLSGGEGNVPFVKSLLMDTAAGEKSDTEGPEDDIVNEKTQQVNGTNNDKAEGKKNVKTVDTNSSHPDGSEATTTENGTGSNSNKQVTSKKEKRKTNHSQKVEQVLSLPVEMDVVPESSDLSKFFHYACGEGDDVENNKDNLLLKGNQKNSKKGQKSKPSQKEDEESLIANYESKTKLSPSLVSITYSGYNPPPSQRRILCGDSVYLNVSIALSDVGNNHINGVDDYEQFGITGNSDGFYVNKTVEGQRFAPEPIHADGCYSHTLLDCLLKRSLRFRDLWSSALIAAKERAELSASLNTTDTPLQSLFRVASRINGEMPGVDSVVQRPSWIVKNNPLQLMQQNNHHPYNLSNGGGKNSKKHSKNHHQQDMTMLNKNKWHDFNMAKSEEYRADTYGIDIRNGAARDWNEELQSAREMPVSTLQERIDRARMVYKVLQDFFDASLRGANGIFAGLISPMNPNEPMRSHVYLHNNIFFSRAVDAGLDTYKISSGDNAARKSASRDASCMSALHKLDIKGLHTLATIVLDYMGVRLVCQSIVPGILHGEKTHTLLYGAVEAGTSLVSNDEMHKQLEESLGVGLMVASRKVPTMPVSGDRLEVIMKTKEKTGYLSPQTAKKEESDDLKDPQNTTLMCGPIEAKGIKGSDQRKYLLDLTRFTPRDANWVPLSEGGTGNWEKAFEEIKYSSVGGSGKKNNENYVPPLVADEEWTMAVLRPELITALTHVKMSEYMESKLVKKEQNSVVKSNEEKDHEPEPMLDAKTAADDKDIIEHKNSTASSEKSVEGDVPVDKSRKTNDKIAEKDKGTELPTPNQSTIDDLIASKIWKTTDEKTLQDEDKEYLKSLRYNINVFLPYTRSLEGLDDEAHAQHKNDEGRALEAANYIWHELLPLLTKTMKDNSGHQMPVDGIAVTELLHSRGINCRYLGRLATLAGAEEAKDLAAQKDVQEGKLSKLPRRVMPLCWLEILECEIVARAAKHVLDSYLTENCGAAALRPAQTIAAFLSALLSTGEESASETEARISKQEKAANGRMNGSNLEPDDEELAKLTISNVGGGSNFSPITFRSRGEVWEAIEKEVGRRFRYTLTLYNQCDNSPKSNEGSVLYMPLLQRVCERTGIRLAAKKIELGVKCLCGGSGNEITASYPISPIDIVDVLPMVKHAAAYGEGFVPCSFTGTVAAPPLHVLLPDAKATIEAAHMHWHEKSLPNALELAQEAASLYQRVVDTPLHAGVGRCLDLTAVVLFQAQELDMAAANASRALAVAVQLFGFDSSEAVTAHSTLAHILISSGNVASGFKHLRAVVYLMELMSGPRYVELSNIYHKLGTMYHEIGNGINALRFYQAASTKCCFDRLIECMISKSTALVLGAMGQFKPALDNEKRAYGLYRLVLGDEHELTKNSGINLQHFTKLAVEQGSRRMVEEKKLLEEDKKRQEEAAANSAATMITEADELEKKKKKKNRKKNKK